MLEPGALAPDFSLTAHTGETIRLSALRGAPVVLFFYPGDHTPVCTKEACAFRDQHEVFLKTGATVLGVSADDADSHQRFAADLKLPFLLLSDPGGGLRKRYGVPKTLGFLPGRATFLIDREGVLRHAFASAFNARAHVREALGALESLR